MTNPFYSAHDQQERSDNMHYSRSLQPRYGRAQDQVLIAPCRLVSFEEIEFDEKGLMIAPVGQQWDMRLQESEIDTSEDFLLPCPFCGSQDIDWARHMADYGKKAPRCDNCGAQAESVDDWNTRTPPE